MKEQILGGHLRTAEGLRFVAAEARALDYRAVQIMVGEGRGYNPYDFQTEAMNEYRRSMFGILTYVHLPYVINPCESKPRRRSICPDSSSGVGTFVPDGHTKD